ncbi:MAG: DUF3300 domain-containing protein [Verrucomicrobiia bacterium]|jgi:hypothetical protein
MKLTTLFRIGVAVLVGAVLSAEALAQMPVPPPGPDVPLLSSAELDQLLEPIALYPDPLIAQILPAATVPSTIVLVDRYVSSGVDVNQIDQQQLDDSVKALARYPDVLKMMDDNLEWTTALGQAFANQPAGVMDSIQRLRAQAQALGNLGSTPQQEVVADDGDIDIVPANPDVIYVPVYQPDAIFVQRCLGPGFCLSFGAGFAIGAWLNHDCDWHNHHVIVWPHDHPRPRDWWHRPPGQRGRPGVGTVTAPGHRDAGSAGATVWHPRNRPVSTTANRSDRGWNVPETRATVPKVIRPAPAPVESRGTPIPIIRPAVPVQRVAPVPRERPAAGALIGVQSARETREFSSRGVESRQTITTAVPAAHPSAPTEFQGSGDAGQRRQR